MDTKSALGTAEFTGDWPTNKKEWKELSRFLRSSNEPWIEVNDGERASVTRGVSGQIVAQRWQFPFCE